MDALADVETRETQKRLLLSIDAVGAQWLVRELARQGATGRLDAKDDWATYQLSLFEGQVVGATAQAGPHRAGGERAFIAFLASRSANGSVVFGDPGAPADASPLGTMDALIDRAVATLNEREQRAREALLVNAGRGRIVDTDALVAELQAERLWAALDVTHPEPLPKDHPLWACRRTIISPHSGRTVPGTNELCYQVAATQIQQLRDGNRPANATDERR